MTVHHQISAVNKNISAQSTNNLTVGEAGQGAAGTKVTAPSGSSAAAGAAPAVATTVGSRPKHISTWTVADVQKWFRRNCNDLYHLYSELFLQQDITGRSLVRLNENSLLRLGVVHPEHRQVILLHISKLRLKFSLQMHMQLQYDIVEFEGRQ